MVTKATYKLKLLGNKVKNKEVKIHVTSGNDRQKITVSFDEEGLSDPMTFSKTFAILLSMDGVNYLSIDVSEDCCGRNLGLAMNHVACFRVKVEK